MTSSSSAGPGRCGSPPSAPPIIDGAGSSEKVEFRVAQLRAELERATFGIDEEVLSERIGSLSGKVAVIRVGAPTNAELAELQHRVEDALSATRAAMAEGIVAGGGVALMHAAPVLDELDVKDDYATGVEIVRRALTEPTYLIATNAGYPGHEVVAEVAKMGVDEGFDALEGRYGNMIDMGIIDPLRVCRSALQNGASVAGLLLTTNTLIAEEQTPWGGSRALMTEFGAARRGPAPALARLQHPAVAGPRPVGRVTGTDAPANGGTPGRPPAAEPPVVVRRLESASAPLLGDLVETFEELQMVLRCCERLVDRARPGPTDPTTSWSRRSGRWRCSPTRAASPRATASVALTEEDLTAAQPESDVLEWHQVLLQLRDHYADPAANPRERFTVAVTQDADGAASGVAITSARQPLVDDLTVRQTGAIAYALSDLVNDRIEAQQQHRLRRARGVSQGRPGEARHSSTSRRASTGT